MLKSFTKAATAGADEEHDDDDDDDDRSSSGVNSFISFGPFEGES